MGKNSLKIKSKVCTKCLKEKPASSFYMVSRTGKPMGRCKNCFLLYKENAGKNFEKKVISFTLPDLSTKSSFDFLKALPRRIAKNAWTFPEFKEAYEILKEQVAIQNPFYLESIKNKLKTRNINAIRAVVDEFKECAKEGLTLEEYWKSGRKFRAGNKEILPGKKR